MRLFTNLTALAFSTLLFACGNTNETKEAGSESTENGTKSTISYKIAPQESTINWLGEVAGVYGHDGTISIAEGNVTVQNAQIATGSITIDMTSITPANPENYADEDGKRASDLKSHLSTGDFFLVEEYPTATFTIKSQEGDKLVGDLTIRGKTNEETATITSMEATEQGMTAAAKLVFNRQKYDVAWVHFMKDMILSDDIQLTISIVGKP
jgi:polyisoprenoid-binding protein YceI